MLRPIHLLLGALVALPLAACDADAWSASTDSASPPVWMFSRSRYRVMISSARLK